MKKSLVAFILVTLCASAIFASGNTITMKGSDTMVRLGQRLAEEYMKKTPGVVVQVIGGGSGTGFAALVNNTTDICQASRDIKDQEVKDAEAKGIKPYRIRVALDGIAVFLHESNPVNELSLSQIKDIYTGVITNWKQVGGPDKKIVVYTRENNSGTYVFFKEHVLKNEDFSDYAQPLPGTSAVVHAVAQDPSGIGYGGIAWASGVKQALVKATDTTAAIGPTVEAVIKGEYPISRHLFWFTNGVPKDVMKAFVNYALSTEGQKVVAEADYVPLPAEETTPQILK